MVYVSTEMCSLASLLFPWEVVWVERVNWSGNEMGRKVLMFGEDWQSCTSGVAVEEMVVVEIAAMLDAYRVLEVVVVGHIVRPMDSSRLTAWVVLGDEGLASWLEQAGEETNTRHVR